MRTYSIPTSMRSVTRLPSGLVSVWGNTLTLRNRSNAEPTTITAASGVGTVLLRYKSGNQIYELDFQDVQNIAVWDAKIHIVSTGESSGTIPQPSPARGETPPIPTTESPRAPSTPQDNNTQLKQKNEELKKNLAEASQLLNSLRSSVTALTAENNKLKNQYNGLSKAVETGLDKIIADIQNRQFSFSQTLQDKITQFQELQTKISETEAEINRRKEEHSATTSRLQELQRQLSKIRGQQETAELDCDSVSGELDALRTRYQMNSTITELTEDRWLKNNSVKETMEDLTKMMDSVENRIGLILKLRETYNSTVQSTVLVGNGTMPIEAESGNFSSTSTPEHNTASSTT